MQTVNGPTTGYFVRLEKVRVGGIELRNVEGIVVEGLGDFGLLGMSFLNRLEMRRDGDKMEPRDVARDFLKAKGVVK